MLNFNYNHCFMKITKLEMLQKLITVVCMQQTWRIKYYHEIMKNVFIMGSKSLYWKYFTGRKRSSRVRQ